MDSWVPSDSVGVSKIVLTRSYIYSEISVKTAIGAEI